MIDFICSLAGNEFECGCYSRWFSETLHPLSRSFCVVLFGERGSDCIENSSAAWQLGANRNFEFSGLNCSTWLRFKCLEPSRWFVIPRTHKHSVIDDYHPNTRVAVFNAGANAENLRVAQRFYDVVTEVWHRSLAAKKHNIALDWQTGKINIFRESCGAVATVEPASKTRMLTAGSVGPQMR